jgi:hypothetical protein
MTQLPVGCAVLVTPRSSPRSCIIVSPRKYLVPTNNYIIRPHVHCASVRAMRCMGLTLQGCGGHALHGAHSRILRSLKCSREALVGGGGCLECAVCVSRTVHTQCNPWLRLHRVSPPPVSKNNLLAAQICITSFLQLVNVTPPAGEPQEAPGPHQAAPLL